VKCEDLVDKHVGAFEMSDGKIQDIDCEMSQDSVSIVQTRFNLNLLCDLHMLLGLFCLLPLLEAVHALIKFAQGKDIFICDFVATIKICQVNLCMMYSYPSSNY